MPKQKLKEIPNAGVREIRHKTPLKRVNSFEEIDENVNFIFYFIFRLFILAFFMTIFRSI